MNGEHAVVTPTTAHAARYRAGPAAASGPVPPPAARRRGRRAALATPVLLAVAGLLAAGYVLLADPYHPGHFFPCPWLALTGTYDPTCGGLRMIYSLGHGHPVRAFGENPLLAVAMPAVLATWAVWVWRAAHGRPAPAWPRHPAVLVAIGVVVLTFWVVRNLPLGAALAP